MVKTIGVDVVAAGRCVLRDAVRSSVRREHRDVVVTLPAPVEVVSGEGFVERAALQLGGVGEGADRAEQDGGHGGLSMAGACDVERDVLK